MKPFIQAPGQKSTLGFWKEILVGNNLPTLAAFAYVTDSGVAQVSTHLAELFRGSRRGRWVFGMDYGRSQPSAIRRIAALGRNHEIRIHDGDHVVQSEGFIPRISYHLKTVLTTETNGLPAKQIVGSGNLSASGLGAGIEAGCLVDHSTIDPSCSKALILELEKIWESSIPFGRLIDAYEAGYKLLTQPNVKSPKRKASAARETFWIDVGYVTKNRGEDRPGNQFDLPRGSHEFLGIAKVINPRLNSVLGEVNIGTPRGQIVARSLRFGNNAMEKLTLPIPEEHGYECYDGKILTFNVRQNGTLDLLALEYDDFFRIYGQNITSSKEMQSGRRYGTVALGT